jgi:kanamycin kinase/aminoglycoside 3'-phosphotransferase-3
MEFKFKLTSFLNDFVDNAELQEIGIGCSDSQIVKITKDSGVYYLKVSKNSNVRTEHMKLKWLQGKLAAPKIIFYEEKDCVNYLLTESLDGGMVCSDYYMNNHEEGLCVIIESLNSLKSIDISDCPFNVGVNHKLSIIKHNIDNNPAAVNDVVGKEALDKYGSIEAIYNYLISNKPIEEPAFSHGDPSLPNIFGKQNEFTGFIDVGDCGIADFWWDVTIVAKSIKRNYGTDALDRFYQKLNCEIKCENIEYYMLLLNLDV